ncbi:hypothetical protein LZ32DRAFT_612105 [Colletotrichum eremochloae]|nr:hypothetical protein LZ32DRAFT_612105 [Colletotrichum eremochloae]
MPCGAGWSEGETEEPHTRFNSPSVITTTTIPNTIRGNACRTNIFSPLPPKRGPFVRSLERVAEVSS